MDIKDLNKPQLILLAVLLSFVTSIATGITTVTLMQQAPQSITTPINRVVQQTIEKIQQVEGKTVTQTVIVKEEDLVVDAIAKNKSAVFVITKEVQGPTSKNIEVSAGQGFALSNDGTLVADSNLVWEGETFFVKNDSGKFHADYVSQNTLGFAILKIGDPVNGTDKIAVTPPTFGDLSKMKMGQKILVYGDSISSFIFDGNQDIKLNVTNSNGGAVVLDLDGNVLGIALSREISSFLPIDSIRNTFIQ